MSDSQWHRDHLVLPEGLVVAVPAVEVGVGVGGGGCSHLLWYCATRTGGGRQCSLDCHFLFVVLPI